MRVFPKAYPGIAAIVFTISVFSASLATADPPPLSDLIFLPGDDGLAPAAGRQLSPEIAAGGDGYLAVWVDTRTGLTEMASYHGGQYFDHHIGTMWDIYGARLDAAGELIDTSPILINRDIQSQGMPDVAWNGSNWLVVWSGQTGLQCCPSDNRFAARVSPDGVVLDETPILLGSDVLADAGWPAAVGSDGTNWLVVWTSNGNRVTAMRVAPDGSVLDPQGVVLYTGGDPGDYDIAFADGEYFIVWSSGGRTGGGVIQGRRAAPDLTPIGPAIPINLYASSVGLNCRVTTDEDGYFVVWWEDRYYGWSQLVGARVTGDGVVLDPDGLPLTEAYGYSNYEPAVAWDGTNYVVTYDRYTGSVLDLFAARVTQSGEVLDYDTEAITVSAGAEGQWESAIASLSADGPAVVLWRDARYAGTGYGDIFSATLAADGSVGPERHVALGAPRQTHLRLVPNGTGYLAVFLSETGFGSRILAQRIDVAGQAIDPEPVEVASGGGEVTHPSAAWDGSVYMIVWEDKTANEVYGRRLDGNLAGLDPLPVSLLPGNRPDVAAVGGVFLVVCTYEEPHEIQQVYSLRVRGADGALLDPSPPVVGGNHARFPRVAAFPDRWVVVWERHPSHDNPNSSIQGNIVNSSGAPLGSFSISGTGDLPAVSAGSTEALVAWEAKNGPTVEDLDVFARRIRSDGTFLDGSPFTVATAENAQFDVAVGWTGSVYLTAFGDFRNDEEYASKPGDLYGARVEGSGSVLDPEGFAFATASDPEMQAHAAGIGGDLMIGGSIFRPEPGFANYRIGLRSSARSAGISEDPGETSPLRIVGTRPNPFRGRTAVEFALSRSDRVEISVHDAAGRLIRRLTDRIWDTGPHAVSWDGTDGAGQPVSAGVYFLRLETERWAEARPVVLLR